MHVAHFLEADTAPYARQYSRFLYHGHPVANPACFELKSALQAIVQLVREQHPHVRAKQTFHEFLDGTKPRHRVREVCCVTGCVTLALVIICIVALLAAGTARAPRHADLRQTWAEVNATVTRLNVKTYGHKGAPCNCKCRVTGTYEYPWRQRVYESVNIGVNKKFTLLSASDEANTWLTAV